MKVRIIAATEENWYRDEIGKEYEVDSELTHTCHLLKNSQWQGIDKNHCKIIENECDNSNKLLLEKLGFEEINNNYWRHRGLNNKVFYFHKHTDPKDIIMDIYNEGIRDIKNKIKITLNL